MGTDIASGRRLRLGMVGGGEGAFIGQVHRMAARLDGHWEVVAGALSSDPARARASARACHIADDRSYDDFRQMAATEAVRPDGIDAVAVVTPNHLHHQVAAAFLEAGIHVLCDKPLTTTLADADELVARVRASGLVFAVTYTYAGYAMVREAAAMVADGALGDLRVVQVEYPQDWLAAPIEKEGQKQAAWRTDPALAGPGGSTGDIGTHAFHLAYQVTGQLPDRLLADLGRFLPGRRLDDNAHVLLRYPGGTKGMLWASQVATGNENALKLRLYGSKAGLIWTHEQPDELWFAPLGGRRQRLSRGGAQSGVVSAALARVPAGHPEGYLEAFATLYSAMAQAIRDHAAGKPPIPGSVPGVEEGRLGVAFVEAVVASDCAQNRWVAFPPA